jgi:signal transduction histidine kinase/CheY-like chemotaxis protein
MLTEEKLAVSNIERVDRLSKGIDRLKEGKIDGVLLDLGLPDSQGLNTFEKIHTTAQKVPIIILTAYKDDALALEAVRRGAQDYLIKGKIDGSGLVRALSYAIERKKLEEKVEKGTISLKKSEEKYHKLFDSIDEGFCIVEMVFDADCKPLDYRFLEINAAFERQTGLHDAQGKLMRTLAPNLEEIWFEIYGRIALTGQPIRFSSEAKALNRHYDVFAFPVGEEKIRKVGILFNDISERRILEKQLQDQERLAAIGATAGMVGHDIRNPLQSMIGELFLSRKELENLPESDAKKYLKESIQSIEDNAFYINKIVTDLQDFAKPSVASIEETNFKKIVDDVLATLKAPENITVTYSLEPYFEKIMTDPSAMKRIITNLCSNAIQAMPKGGKLTLNGVLKDEEVFITVQDTGVGIADETKNKLFKPLFTTKSKGQGFGLAVVKKLTETLNGKVSVESEVGKGTQFILEFPILKADTPIHRARLRGQ